MSLYNFGAKESSLMKLSTWCAAKWEC